MTSVRKNNTGRDQLRSQKSTISNPDDENKIAMWLPSFSPIPGQSENTGRQDSNYATPSRIQSQKVPPQQQLAANNHKPPIHQKSLGAQSAKGNSAMDNSNLMNNSTHKGYKLNATASSSATFVRDGRAIVTQTGLMQQTQNDQNNNLSIHSPAFSESYKQAQSDSQGHFRNTIGQSQNSMESMQKDSGYNPDFHQNKPRVINSNHEKQRAFNQSQGSNSSGNQSSSG